MIIGKWLDEHKIKYQKGYRFNECRNIRPLPFDFAVFSKNKLITLIEFDGKQHFETIEYWGGEDNLKFIQQNDDMNLSRLKSRVSNSPGGLKYSTK